MFADISLEFKRSIIIVHRIELIIFLRKVEVSKLEPI